MSENYTYVSAETMRNAFLATALVKPTAPAPTPTPVRWKYRVSFHNVYGYADDGILLDNLVNDCIPRVDKLSDITIEVIFGGDTTP